MFLRVWLPHSQITQERILINMSINNQGTNQELMNAKINHGFIFSRYPSVVV